MYKITALLLFACLLTTAAGCKSDDNPVSTPDKGLITGLITGGSPATLLSGATITTIPATKTVTTDSLGRYTISDIVAGRYAVKVVMPGFTDGVDSASVVGGGSSVVNFHLVAGTSGGGDSLRTPSNPTPADGAQQQPVSVVLSWAASGPAADSVEYEVYLGTTQSPALVASDLTQPTHTPAALTVGAVYYWRVVATNRKGETKSGPLWSFSTGELENNLAPIAPNTPTPVNGAIGQNYNVNLRWNCSDPDGDILKYDVFFGTSSNLTSADEISSGQSATFLSRSDLVPGATYYWKVVARDNHNGVTPGPVWSFTVRTNLAPNRPQQPFPANGASNVSVVPPMQWIASDDDGDPLVYDIYLGTGSEAATLVASGLNQPNYTPAPLLHGTTYYWKVVARDSYSGATAGPVWSFTTLNPLTQGLVAHYTLDGHASDVSGNGHDGSLSGPQPTSDRHGIASGALRFTGQSYVEVPHSSELTFQTSDFSIVSWVRYAAEQDAYGGIVVKCTPDAPEMGYQLVGNGFALAGQIGTTSGYFDFSGTRNLNDGNWHFVAMTVSRSSRTVKLYIDGVLVKSETNSKLGNPISGTPSLFLGKDRQGKRYFKGSIDEVKLYNFALTQEQVQAVENE